MKIPIWKLEDQLAWLLFIPWLLLFPLSNNNNNNASHGLFPTLNNHRPQTTHYSLLQIELLPHIPPMQRDLRRRHARRRRLHHLPLLGRHARNGIRDRGREAKLGRRIPRHRRNRHIRFRRRRVGRPVGLVAARHRHLARRQVHVAEHAAEGGERTDGLVKGDFVAGLVHPQEAEVAVLAHLAKLGPVDDKGRVARGAELGRVDVVDLEGDGLAAEPVTDVVCVAVDQRYSDRVVENCFKVREKIGINEVARFLECIVNVVVGICVV